MSSAHLSRLLDTCIEHEADTLQLSAGKRPTLTFDERQVELKTGPLTSNAIDALITEITSDMPPNESNHADGASFQFDYDNVEPNEPRTTFHISISRQQHEITFARERAGQ